MTVKDDCEMSKTISKWMFLFGCCMWRYVYECEKREREQFHIHIYVYVHIYEYIQHPLRVVGKL